jgi:Cu+-exporting ATPase
MKDTAPESSQPLETVKDPVCGMTINPNKAFARQEHAGKTYYFCSGHCREKFRAEPERYAA